MYGPSALAAYPAVEGAFVLGAYNDFATVNGGPAASPRAGAHGVGIGRFAWMGVDGVVLNARSSSQDLQGIVIAPMSPQVDWRWVFYDDVSQTFRIREGLPCPLLAAGNMWVRFPNGARYGESVYANVLDGTPISGYSADGELTPWSVSRPCAANELAIISTRGLFS